MVRKQAILVLLAVTLFGALGGLIATYIQPVRYQADAYVVIYGMPRGFTELIGPDEAPQVAAIYRTGMLQSAVVKQVQAELPGYSADDIARAVQVQVVAYTPRTKITATASTAAGAARLANVVANAWISVAGVANEHAYTLTKATLDARKTDLIQSITFLQNVLAHANPKARSSPALQSLRDALAKTETAIQELDQTRKDAEGNAKMDTSAQASDAVRSPDPVKNLGISVVVGFFLGLALDLWLMASIWKRQETPSQPSQEMRVELPRVLHKAASGL